MPSPASAHFTPLSLTHHFNVDRSQLDGGLRLAADPANAATPLQMFGRWTLQGVPFDLGQPDQPNVILLQASSMPEGVDITVDQLRASYLLFLHAVEDRATNYAAGFADSTVDGNELGHHVSDYVLSYDDGTQSVTPVLRRFAIQQLRIGWGASPFAAVPAFETGVFLSATEEQWLGRVAQQPPGRSETRHVSGRDRRISRPNASIQPEQLWIYALPNPFPAKPIQRIVCRPHGERSVIFAISATTLVDHPLRPGVRQRLRLQLPEGLALNALGEVDVTPPHARIEIDLGTVISARAALEYDHEQWLADGPTAQPQQSERSVIVDYAAHPQARLHVSSDSGTHSYDLTELAPPPADGEVRGATPRAIEPVNPAHRPVRLRVLDQHSGVPVSVRLHLHGQDGEYLPPKGYHRKVNPYWFEDRYAEFVNGLNQYCYIPGECEVDLPLGRVYVEISRGYETDPIRTCVEVTPETENLTFALDRRLGWRDRGWVSADTHVHFLTPQTALLEGAAEGVNVVNLLASQWGEMFSNVGDFDGRSTLGAQDFGGSGEFLVRVGTENRMQVLGHISLLGYSGSMIQPLCTGGPSESAIGDALEVTMAEWAERCIQQGGLVVMPHAPNPQAERAADIVLGLVHAVEMMTFNPFDAQINPYGLADWYRYLNLGYQIPVVGGSDKMSAASLLGGIRTYAHLGDRPFTYQTWMEAVQAGNTFVTVGPLVELTVDGHAPGGRLHLPATGGTLDVSWRVESVSLPIDQVEIIVGGLVAEQVNLSRQLMATGETRLAFHDSTWIALRVRGSYRGRHGEVAAHTSAVQIIVGDKPIYAEADALAILEQIEGAIAYVDTLAPRPEAQRYKRLRATLEAAHNRMHQHLHRQGIFHQHTPLHRHDQPHEH